MMKEKFLRQAIQLSCDKIAANEGGPFAAIVVRDGEEISRAWNQVLSQHDPTAHAEVLAIRKACKKLGTHNLSDCEIYSSCEPCPMCLSAIYWARLQALYYAAQREDAAAVGFDDDLIYRELPLPPNQRRLPTEKALRKDAQQAFATWNSKSDKVTY